MADAGVLRCPSCGSPADPNAQRCPFCKSRLAAISCPSCFGLMFDSAKFCPRCGAAASRVERDAAPAECPSCQNELQGIDIGTTTLRECTGCDGVWLDADSFERLLARSETRAAVLHRLENIRQHPTTQNVRYRRCPQCGTMMNRVNFGKVSGTVVDVCKGHGTWLDAGELHQIVAFVQNGGLERARDAHIQELKDQERRTLELERRAAHDGGRGGSHSAMANAARRGWSAADLLDVIDLIRRNS